MSSTEETGAGESSSMTFASTNTCPVSRATETRWLPSFTKYASPSLYSSTGGNTTPVRSARSTLSHRPRVQTLRGRNARSKSRYRLTLPTICSTRTSRNPTSRWPRTCSCRRTSSNESSESSARMNHFAILRQKALRRARSKSARAALAIAIELDLLNAVGVHDEGVVELRARHRSLVIHVGVTMQVVARTKCSEEPAEGAEAPVRAVG